MKEVGHISHFQFSFTERWSDTASVWGFYLRGINVPEERGGGSPFPLCVLPLPTYVRFSWGLEIRQYGGPVKTVS